MVLYLYFISTNLAWDLFFAHYFYAKYFGSLISGLYLSAHCFFFTENVSIFDVCS